MILGSRKKEMSNTSERSPQSAYVFCLNRSKADDFFFSSTTLFFTNIACLCSSFIFSNFALIANYIGESVISIWNREEQKRGKGVEHTVAGSITFFLCFLKYLFILLFFPLILFFSFCSFNCFLFPSSISAPSTPTNSSEESGSSVVSTFPVTRNRSKRGNRAKGVSVAGFPSDVTSFEFALTRLPMESGSRVIRSG